MNLSDKDIQALTVLWAELASFSTSEVQASRDHAMRALSKLIDADLYWWTASLKVDPEVSDTTHEGWKVLASYRLDETGKDRKYADLMHAHYAAGHIDLFTQLRLKVPGPCICHRPVDVMSEEQWLNDWFHREVRKPAGLGDTLAATYRMDASTHTHMGMDRGLGDPPFTERDRDLLQLFMAGAGVWHSEQFLAGGWVRPRNALTPREHEVLSALLTNASEQQIADRMGLTVGSVHQYITNIYRYYGVSGRRGLMALFLRYAFEDRSLLVD